MSNWKHQLSNKFCCWFFWAPERRMWETFLKAGRIQWHHTLKLPENQFKIIQTFARNERSSVLQLGNIQTQLITFGKRSADKSDVYTHRETEGLIP